MTLVAGATAMVETIRLAREQEIRWGSYGSRGVDEMRPIRNRGSIHSNT